MRKLIITAICLACLTGQASADFYDGLRAFDAGDYTEAATEWRVSADHGDVKSQLRLGQLNEEGLGVPQNFVEAHRWYNIAASSGDQEAREARNAIARMMTPEQVAEAQALAASWRPGSKTQTTESPEALPSLNQIEVEGEASSLFRAVRNGDQEGVAEALRSGADPDAKFPDGNPVLISSIVDGYVEIVGTLLEADADANAQAPNGWSALLMAIFYGHPAVAKTLIDGGADVNFETEDGISPTTLALDMQSNEIIGLLRDAGAEVPEAPDSTKDSADEDLFLAVLSGDQEFLHFLLGQDLNVNVTDEDGWTPVMVAAFENNAEAIAALADAGADLNTQAADGSTALMVAAVQGHEEAAKALIDRRADVQVKTEGGVTAIFIAEQQREMEIAKLIESAMPKPQTPTVTKTQVAEVQRLLAVLGYEPGPADGIPGKRTRIAVRTYRERADLGGGDIIDESLLTKLRHDTEGSLAKVNLEVTSDLAELRKLKGIWCSVDLASAIFIVDKSTIEIRVKYRWSREILQSAFFVKDIKLIENAFGKHMEVMFNNGGLLRINKIQKDIFRPISIAINDKKYFFRGDFKRIQGCVSPDFFD